MSVAAMIFMFSLGVSLISFLCLTIAGIWGYDKAVLVFTIIYICAMVVAGIAGAFLVVRFIETGILFFSTMV